MNYELKQIVLLEWYHYCLSIVLFLVTLYILIVIFSFCFMMNFSIKTKKTANSINLILYQKAECMLRIVNHMKSLVKDNQLITDFSKQCDIKDYKIYNSAEFDSINTKENAICKEIKLIYINNKNIPNKSEVIVLLKSYEDLCKNYAKQIQYYNTFVVGYNYWLNLFSTKWIKLLFKKKEKELIK